MGTSFEIRNADGSVYGQMTAEEIRVHHQAGELNREMQIRKLPDGKWASILKVKELTWAEPDYSNQSQQVITPYNGFKTPYDDFNSQVIDQFLAPIAPTPPVPAVVSNDDVECPFCGEQIKKQAKKCKHCNEIVDITLRATSRPATNYESTSAVNVSNVIHVEGGRRERRWSKGIAALLSFLIPGAGQMYKGEVGGGLAWMLFVAIGYVAFIIPGFILHIFCIIAAACGDEYR